MKKRNNLFSLLTVAAICSFTSLNAQNISVNAGINISNLRYHLVEESSGIDTSYYRGMGLGVRVGGEYTHQLNDKMGIEAGLYFSQRASENSGTFESYKITSRINVNYFDIPVNLKYSLPLNGMKLNLKAGALLGLGLSGTSSGGIKYTQPGFEDQTYNDEIKLGTEGEIKRMDLGVNIGASIDINKFNIGLTYNRSLGNIVDVPKGEKSSLAWSVFNLTLGYYILN
jgi:hypothetical protein